MASLVEGIGSLQFLAVTFFQLHLIPKHNDEHGEDGADDTEDDATE